MGFGGLVRADMQFWRFCLHHSTFMSVWSGSSNMYIWAWPLGAKNLVAKSQIPEIVFETENDVRLHFQHHKSWISRWTDPAPHHSTRVTRVYGLFLGEIMWCTNENHPSADARLTEAARRWRCFSKPMHDHHRRPSPEISRRSRVRRHPETSGDRRLDDLMGHLSNNGLQSGVCILYTSVYCKYFFLCCIPVLWYGYIPLF